MAVRLTARSRRSRLHRLPLPALLLLPLASIASAAVLALPTSALATTVTFTYGSFHNGYPDPTTSWYDARNWSPEQVPRAEDDVILPDGEPVPSDYTGGTLRSLNVAPTGFHVFGSLTLTAGTSTFGPWTTDLDGTLTVGAAATLIIQGDYNNVGGDDTVVNYGTIVGHDIGYPRPSVGSPVYNHGTLTCDAGTLWLYQGGISYTGSVIGGGDGIVQLYHTDPYVVVDWTLQGGCDVVGGVEISDIVSVPEGETVSFTGINAVDLAGGLYGPGTVHVPAGSTLGLNGYGDYDDGLTLDNDGTIVVGDSNPYQWHGGVHLDNSGTLHLAGDYRGLGVDTSEGRATLLNTGTILSDATDPYIDMSLDNRGTIRVAGGSLMLGALQNYDVPSRTLDGGSYEVEDGGVLRIAEADIAHLAARVTLTGADSRIEDYSYVSNALRNLATVDDSGALLLDSGQALTTGPLVNAGVVAIGTASSLTTGGAYTQAAGDTLLEATTAQLATTGGSVNVTGGFLSGVGTVSSAVTCSGGWVRPGGSGACGTLTVAGTYTQTGSGWLQIEVGGTGAGAYDVLAVTGAASLDGYLLTRTVNGFAPSAGQSFTVLTCGSRSGTFKVWRSPKRKGTPDFAFTTVYSATGLRLVATGN